MLMEQESSSDRLINNIAGGGEGSDYHLSLPHCIPLCNINQDSQGMKGLLIASKLRFLK
jgi:hypothetical protein